MKSPEASCDVRTFAFLLLEAEWQIRHRLGARTRRGSSAWNSGKTVQTLM
jgi:hypothetical protein